MVRKLAANTMRDWRVETHRKAMVAVWSDISILLLLIEAFFNLVTF